MFRGKRIGILSPTDNAFELFLLQNIKGFLYEIVDRSGANRSLIFLLLASLLTDMLRLMSNKRQGTQLRLFLILRSRLCLILLKVTHMFNLFLFYVYII